MTNEQRAEEIINKYKFDFNSIPKSEIRGLIEAEISNYQPGSSEYIRVLCGYLFCIGDESDISLLEKAKYSINMDIGCMIDGDWIESLKNNGQPSEYLSERSDLIADFTGYYKNFKADDDDY